MIYPFSQESVSGSGKAEASGRFSLVGVVTHCQKLSSSRTVDREISCVCDYVSVCVSVL